MEYSVMDQYWIWLSAVEGVGPRRFYQILSLFTDPRDVWENEPYRVNTTSVMCGPAIFPATCASRAAPAVWELLGPIIRGPMTSKTLRSAS